MSDDATLDADIAAATTFPPELVNETPIFGADWRAEAEKQGDLVHSLGAQSHEAFAAGDHAKAKDLSDQSKAAAEARDAANAKAAASIWAQKNNGKDLWEIDLHLLLLEEAMEKVTERLALCKRSQDAGKGGQLVIIHGQGEHSAATAAAHDGHCHPTIKPAVQEYLTTNSYKWTADTERGQPNAGCLTVDFQ